jgi:hypothetical protein
MPTARKLEHLRVYATPRLLHAADAAYSACWRWGHLTQHGSDNDPFYDEQDAYNNAELALYDVIRLDLGLEGIIQPDGRPRPGSGWTTELPDPDEATTSNNPVSR